MKQLFALLFLIGVIGVYFWQITVVAALGLAAWWGVTALRTHRARVAAVIARADQQHAWVLSGDPRGTYGESYTSLA